MAERASSAAAEPILSCRDLQRSFRIGSRSIPVLHGIDLDVYEGEVLGLMGTSGAGKSTLLHLLGLLDRPSRGKVLLRGEDVSSRGGLRRGVLRNREIGFVFQFYHLIPELSALGNILLTRMVQQQPLAWLLRRRRERARAIEVLSRVGLGERLRHLPAQLSGGERQRVAIARALLGSPALILCDEPTGNLDSVTGGEIMELLFEINHCDGTTFVIVSHDERMVERCDRVLHLRDGRIENHAEGALSPEPESTT